MKKILFMGIIISILTFLGCKSKEEKFLENNKVLFCKTEEFESFIKKSRVTPEKAWDLMVEYTEKENVQQPHLFYFIIDGHYVFTNYVHLKIPDAYTGGIWVNSENGKVKEVKDGVFIKAYYKYDWNK
ncbi:MAG: hypothetical protein JEZ01_18695 [Labilibaculum sp.]|nr:hypothetical protein [Labilibaculum sp.]MBI9059800.1 hypothetical protein [Labilibaculum sp.]